MQTLEDLVLANVIASLMRNQVIYCVCMKPFCLVQTCLSVGACCCHRSYNRSIYCVIYLTTWLKLSAVHGTDRQGKHSALVISPAVSQPEVPAVYVGQTL